jgi:hypothetical protein
MDGDYCYFIGTTPMLRSATLNSVARIRNGEEENVFAYRRSNTAVSEMSHCSSSSVLSGRSGFSTAHRSSISVASGSSSRSGRMCFTKKTMQMEHDFAFEQGIADLPRCNPTTCHTKCPGMCVGETKISELMNLRRSFWGERLNDQESCKNEDRRRIVFSELIEAWDGSEFIFKIEGRQVCESAFLIIAGVIADNRVSSAPRRWADIKQIVKGNKDEPSRRRNQNQNKAYHAQAWIQCLANSSEHSFGKCLFRPL